MKILGLNAWFHDASACLLIDGQVAGYVEEERFNRIKHTPEFPQQSLEWILKDAGCTLDDLDEVVFCMNPYRYLREGFVAVISNLPGSLSLARPDAGMYSPIGRVKNMLGVKKTLMENFNAAGDFNLSYMNHYRTHQASAFFGSGFEEAAVLTMDFAGDGWTEVIARGQGNTIKDHLTHKMPHGFAMVYTTITHHLGFSWWDDYKVMGLAAYGKPIYADKIREMFDYDPVSGALKLNMKYFNFYKYGRTKHLSPDALSALLGPPRDAKSEITQREYDLAASLQVITVEYGLALARKAKELTGASKLCMAGGVAQNCLMNQTICKSGLFDEVFIQPLSSDVGCAEGAAWYSYHCHHDKPRSGKTTHLFRGPSFQNESLEAARMSGLNERESVDWHRDVAQAIADGLVVGYFDGKMEIGPRALGSRSILADPRRKDMKDILNSRVKHREHFRPFAPSVLSEEVNDVFEPLETCRSLDYMIVTMNVRDEWKERVPAITHADGTARVQAVRKEYAPNFYQILDNFHKISGVPLVINTSFNDNEPIVCQPHDAISCFLRTRIDLLVLDGRLYFREDNAHVIQQKTVPM